MLKTAKTFLKDLWALTKPFWISEERWAARGLLAVIVFFNLFMVFLDVQFNYWRSDFYDTFQNMDKKGFFYQLGKFGVLAILWIAVAVYNTYLNQMLQIRWRRWLTDKYLGEWIAKRGYYRMELVDKGTDNPDQRISNDLDLFCGNTLSLTLGLLSSVVTLCSFVYILWSLSGYFSFSLLGREVSIPGYMVWVALLYAIFGTAMIQWIGKPLAKLKFNQQKFEAFFRFSLVRFRENAESIALYKGEMEEIASLKSRFAKVVDNWWSIMKRQKAISWFSSSYGQVAIIFPYLVAAPRFFSGSIKLGGLMQTAGAFNSVQSALSWFIDAYVGLAEWKATVDRLTAFLGSARKAQEEELASLGVRVSPSDGSSYLLKDVSIELPGGIPLIDPINIELKHGSSVLVTGPSGSGKSTVFRAIAGIWPFGTGSVLKPEGLKTLFLPQRAYLTIGPLREQLCYPSEPGSFSDDEMKAVLADCKLKHLAGRLDEEQNWAQILSGGEQQRIAFARALLQKPDWLFMDESSSAIDEASEAELYTLLKTRLPECSIVSIGHRESLRRLHDSRLEIKTAASGPSSLVWA